MNNTPISQASPGAKLQRHLSETPLTPFIGVYDVFSASIAAKHFDSLFVSGFGFAASHYGLPDIGFITWTDIVDFVNRLRTVLPSHHLLVDIDDGYCDPEVACHVVSVLEKAGASAVVLEDQKRPRRCGHFEGKQIMELDEYVSKLKAVLATRKEMLVIARTDSSDQEDMARRIESFVEAGADAVLIDGLPDLEIVRKLSARTAKPFCFNQIAGGKSPAYTQTELREAGVSLVIYSTPCLFAAQSGIETAMQLLKSKDGSLANSPISVKDCTAVLNDNLSRRNEWA